MGDRAGPAAGDDKAAGVKDEHMVMARRGSRVPAAGASAPAAATAWRIFG